MTVAVFTFVLLLGNVMKEILALLVARQISLLHVAEAVGLLVPYVMAYVLPFGLLTAILLTFGRFSADQELTAARAGGISLLTLVMPILLLSLLLSGLCGLFNFWIAPQCRGAYKQLVFQMGMQSPANFITEDRFIDEVPGVVLYVRKKQGDQLEDVRLYTLQQGEIVSRIFAKRGEIVWDATGRKISFRLFDSIAEQNIKAQPPPRIEYPEDFIGPPPPEPPEPETAWQPLIMSGTFETDPPIDLSSLTPNERKPRLGEMNLRQLREEIAELEAEGISPLPARVQLQRQLAFSFACFSFTLIGIPLAIRAHRRETTAGVAMSLGLVIAYYAFLILGEALVTQERLHPELIVWIPNVVFQAGGAYLLWRSNRRAV